MTAAQTGTQTGTQPGTQSTRAVPYYCPFCAEEDLRPVARGSLPGMTRGGWHCRSCLRVFDLGFHGIHRSVPDPLGESDE